MCLTSFKPDFKTESPTVFDSGTFPEGFLPEAHIRNPLLHLLHNVAGKKSSLVILVVQNPPQNKCLSEFV